MTNLVSFSEKLIFTVAKKNVLQASNYDGSLIFTKEFEQPICAITVDPIKNNIAVGVKKQGEGKKPNLFAYSINDDKSDLTEFLAFELPHEAIQLKFADYRSNYSILALNSGDIDCINIEAKSSTTLLGSIATGTSFVLTSDQIISADRDARIRISRYPQTFDIKAFGFYHEEFVSSIDLLDSETFVSCDGDGQVVKWNMKGESLVIQRIAEKNTILRKVVCANSMIYTIVENEKTLYVLNKDDLTVAHKIPLNSEPLTLALSPNNVVYLLTISELVSINDKLELNPVLTIDSGETDPKAFSLENQRVKCKKIIHKEDKGTDDYDIWRNPEKSPSRD